MSSTQIPRPVSNSLFGDGKLITWATNDGMSEEAKMAIMKLNLVVICCCNGKASTSNAKCVETRQKKRK